VTQIPDGPVIDKDGLTTAPFMHLFNDISIPDEVVEVDGISTKSIEDEAQEILDDLKEKSTFKTVYSVKTGKGEHNHNLNEFNIKFSINFQTTAYGHVCYSTTPDDIYTDYSDDELFIWTTK